MSLTQIDLDDDVLSEAMTLLGTKTKKETVNAALRDVVQRLKRAKAADKLLEMGMRGDFDQAVEAHFAAKRAWKQAWGEASES